MASTVLLALMRSQLAGDDDMASTLRAHSSTSLHPMREVMASTHSILPSMSSRRRLLREDCGCDRTDEVKLITLAVSS